MRGIQLGEEFQETMVSFSCFPHVLLVALRKRAHVALAKRAIARIGHHVSIATAADDQFFGVRLSSLATLCGFDLNQCVARHWQCIDGVFVNSFHDQLKLPVIERSAGRFFHLRDSLSQTLL
jgi:hypothetical protein